MTPEQINIECALVDGWTIINPSADFQGTHYKKPNGEITFGLPPFTTSYDAIIPLIQRHEEAVEKWLGTEVNWIKLTPQQLATALIKALGRWKE